MIDFFQRKDSKTPGITSRPVSPLLLSYLLVFLFPIVIMSSVSYILVHELSRVKLEQSTAIAMNTLVADLQSEFAALRTISQYLSYTPWVRRMTVPGTLKDNQVLLEPLDVRDYLHELSNYKHINGFATSLAVHFNDSGMSLTSSGSFDDLDWLSEHSYKVEAWGAATWEGLLDRRHNATVRGPVLIQSYHREYQALLYLDTLASVDSSPVATLIAAIDLSSISAILQRHTGPRTAVALISQADGLICSSEQDYTFRHPLAELDWSRFDGYAHVDGSAVAQKPVGIKDFHAVIATPSRDIQIRYYTDRYAVVLLIIIIVVAGLFVAQRFASENYRPIRNAVGILKEHIPEENSTPVKDDYRTLIHGINYIVSKDDALAQQIEKLQTEHLEAILLRIATGDMDSSDSGISFPYRFFTAVLVVFANTRRFSGNSISHLCRKLFPARRARFFAARMSSKEWFILVNTPDRSTADAIKQDAHHALQGRWRRYAERISVGGTYESEVGITRSHQDALYAQEYELVVDSGIMADYETLQVNNHTLYYYPLEVERRIANCLDVGDDETATLLLHDVFLHNRDTKQLSVFAARCLVYNMLSTVLKVANRQELSQDVAIVEERLRDVHSLDEMESFIVDAYRTLGRIIRDKKESRNFELRRGIVAYLDEHFAERNISVLTVAEHFGISPTYLSRFFKDQTGMSFGDSLRLRRVSKAKEHLAEGMSVAASSELVGYADETALRKAFKRCEGITPGDYKQNACGAKQRALAVRPPKSAPTTSET